MNSANDIARLQERIALYGDVKAYEALYHLLSAPLFRFSLTLVRSAEAAEEIVSDVFIRLWQQRDRLAGIRHLRLYLYTMTKNHSLNHIATVRRRGTVSLSDIDPESVATTTGPEEACISADFIRQVKEVIAALPPQARLVFQLVREDGLAYKEVAVVLGLSPLTVRNHLALAIKKLSRMLPPHLYGAIYSKDAFSAS